MSGERPSFSFLPTTGRGVNDGSSVSQGRWYQSSPMASAARDTVADAKCQLSTIQTEMRERLYLAYLEQCDTVAPAFQARGRRVGEKLLNTIIANQAPDSLRYASVVDSHESAAAAPSDSFLTAGAADILVQLDPLLSPILDPFVDGLKTPFTNAVSKSLEDFQTFYTNSITTAAAVGTLSGLAIGGLSGFIIGRYFTNRAGKGH